MDVLDYLYIHGEKKAVTPPSKESKTDVQGYYKTPTGGVISKDIDSLKAYKLRKSKNNQLNNMEDRMAKLESSLDEIKELLKGLTK